MKNVLLMMIVLGTAQTAAAQGPVVELAPGFAPNPMALPVLAGTAGELPAGTALGRECRAGGTELLTDAVVTLRLARAVGNLRLFVPGARRLIVHFDDGHTACSNPDVDWVTVPERSGTARVFVAMPRKPGARFSTARAFLVEKRGSVELATRAGTPTIALEGPFRPNPRPLAQVGAARGISHWAPRLAPNCGGPYSEPIATLDLDGAPARMRMRAEPAPAGWMVVKQDGTVQCGADHLDILGGGKAWLLLRVDGEGRAGPLRGVTVEDVDAPLDLPWLATAPRIRLDGPPVGATVTTVPIAAASGTKRAEPDLLVELGKPIDGLPLRWVELGAEVSLQVLGPIPPSGRKLPEADWRRRLEPGLYALWLHSRGGAGLAHVVGGAPAGSADRLVSNAPAGGWPEVPVERRGVWGFLPLQPAADGRVLRAQLFARAPRAAFVFPRHDLTALATPAGRWSAADAARPAADEPLLVWSERPGADGSIEVLSADGLLYRVKASDLAAAPAGVPKLPAQPRALRLGDFGSDQNDRFAWLGDGYQDLMNEMERIDAASARCDDAIMGPAKRTIAAIDTRTEAGTYRAGLIYDEAAAKSRKKCLPPWIRSVAALERKATARLESWRRRALAEAHAHIAAMHVRPD